MAGFEVITYGRFWVIAEGYAAAAHSCRPACPCDLPSVRTYVLRTEHPPPHPEARSTSLQPSPAPPRPDALGSSPRRSVPLRPETSRRSLRLRPSLAPSQVLQRSHSSCLYQPTTAKLKLNVRKKAYVIIWIQESYNKVVTIPWYTTSSTGSPYSW